MKSLDQDWCGPATPQTILLNGDPRDIQFMNFTKDAMVYQVGDQVALAALVGAGATDKGECRIGEDAGHDAFSIGNLPTSYVVDMT